MQKRILPLLFLMVVGGCTSAPVQEMSEARQMIAAARAAGANDEASLAVAEESLEQARIRLEAGSWGQARELARHAREQAREVLEQTIEKESIREIKNK